MIRFTLPVLALSLTACGAMAPTAGPEQQARAAEARSLNQAIWQTRSPVAVDGRRVNVAVAPDKTYALVSTSDFGQVVTVPQLEQAASTASGCTGKDTSVLSMMSGDRNTGVKTSVFGDAKYTRIDLTCA